MTSSILARDPGTGDLGGAVQSKFLGAGALVLHGRAGVGMVATQAWANVADGPRGAGPAAGRRHRAAGPRGPGRSR